MVMVNEKLKEYRRLVKTGVIDPRVFIYHFGSKRPDKCKCRDCVDYLTDGCTDGGEPIECMKYGIYFDLGGGGARAK